MKFNSRPPLWYNTTRRSLVPRSTSRKDSRRCNWRSWWRRCCRRSYRNRIRRLGSTTSPTCSRPSSAPHSRRSRGSVERQTTAQLAVVTVPSLRGETVEAYAHELFNEWGIGKKGVNNGVLLLVAPTERRMRIEVGYGLEPLLTDSVCGEIRDQAIIPHFKNNDYAGGIIAGTQRLPPKSAPIRQPPAAIQTPDRSSPAPSGTTPSGPAVPSASQRWDSSAGNFAAIRRLYSTTAFVSVTAVGLVLVAIAAYLT